MPSISDMTKGYLSLIQKSFERNVVWNGLKTIEKQKLQNISATNCMWFSSIKWEICQIDSSIEMF